MEYMMGEHNLLVLASKKGFQSWQELAKKSNIGNTTLWRIVCSKQNMPSYRTLVKLAKTLKVNMSEVINCFE